MALPLDLREALARWHEDARRSLETDVPTPLAIDLGMPWRLSDSQLGTTVVRTSDGVNLEWSPETLSKLRELESWRHVEEAARSPEIDLARAWTLNPVEHLARLAPCPDEIYEGLSFFDENLNSLEAALSGDSTQETVWVIPGIRLQTPLQLEEGIILGPIEPVDLAYALNFGLLLSSSTQVRVAEAGCACLRLLDPLQHPGDAQLAIWEALDHLVALSFPVDVRVAGYFNVSVNPSLFGHGRAWSPKRPTRIPSWPTPVGPDTEPDIVRLWRSLRATSSTRPSALSLALNRLAYQVERDRTEDLLLDLMIAAEALFLSGSQAELRYRLSVNAALYLTPVTEELGQRHVLKLMQRAYDARSVIAHGGQPKDQDLVIEGSTYTSSELLSVTRRIVVAAARRAVEDVASRTPWPPDWTELLFP